jgi:hypothetical protein
MKHNKKNTDDSNRGQIILEIINLVNVLKIKALPGWDDIPFNRIITLEGRKDILTGELKVLLNELDKLFEDRRFNNANNRIVKPFTHKTIVSDSIVIEAIATEPIASDPIISEPVASEPISPNLKLKDWQMQIPNYARESIPDWEELTLKELSDEVYQLISQLKRSAVKLELEDYLGELEDLILEEDYEEDDEIDLDNSYDFLEILEKYKDGRLKTEDIEETRVIDDNWRKRIPVLLKGLITDWKTRDMFSFYDEAKSHISKDRENIMPFIAEMSEIIFEEKVQQEEETEEDSIDAVSEMIMSLVEMIILPHLEVMDMIRRRGGKITFSNLWHKPFTEKLKDQVRERDNNRCVVCEGETDLHVHHKIPREKGGLHHPANLVTLCSSCHGVIETADINKAFKKCVTNYKKNKYRQLKPRELASDKRLLQDEVEKSLDLILFKLNQKDEHELMEEVMEISRRLEVIFYE